MVTEPFALTQPFPQNRLINAWELLKESYVNQLVEPKSLVPDRFGKKSGPSWRTWSYLGRDFVGPVHSAQKQATKNAENRKQPISVSSLQEFGVTKEMEHKMQQFLISRSEGEALEVIRGGDHGENYLRFMTH